MHPGRTTSMSRFSSSTLYEDFPAFRLSERAAANRCRRCQSAIWSCLSASVAAFTVHLDPEPLSPLGEAMARFAGLGVWQLYNHYGSFSIQQRTASLIKASDGTEVILKDHICDHTNIRITLPDYFPQFRYDYPEEPPF